MKRGAKLQAQMSLAATLWRPFPSTSIMLFSPIGVARIVKL
jgi:hypothetical protein